MYDQNNAVFYGVGVGPGDPELITRKAERILKSVDWIFLPSEGKDSSSFVRRIVDPLGLPEQKFRPVSLCMSRDRAANAVAYRQAAAEIATELRQGKSAAWMTEGDPLFYSTFVHLYEELCQFSELSIEIVPGVTSVSAAAGCAGVPMASLDERMAVIPASYGLEKLPALLDQFATVVLLKAHAAIDELLQLLAKTKEPIQAVYLENVGTPSQRVVANLESLRGQKLPYFSLVILRRLSERDAQPRVVV